MTDTRKDDSFWANLLVRYGAGSHLLQPLTRLKCWNSVAWFLIALGVVGWCVGLWICRPI